MSNCNEKSFSAPPFVKLMSKQKFKVYKSFESHELWQGTKDL